MASSPALAATGVVCLGLALGVARLGELGPVAPTFVLLALAWATAACAGAWTLRRRTTLPLAVVVVAVLLRAVILGTPPTLSDDVFRYVWEGRVLVAGYSPFELAPDAPELVHLRDALWSQVNHRGVSTIYPPAALWLFEGVARVWPSPMAWKVLAGLADLACLGALAALARRRGTGAWAPALWALHPLPVLESAGSGHLEALALAPLLLALLLTERGPRAATIAAAVGSLVKLLPLALLAPLLRRASGRLRLQIVLIAGLVWALAVLPHLDAGLTLGRGFGRYYEAWAFNGSLFPLLEAVIGDPGATRAVGVLLGAALAAWALWRRPDPAAFLLWACGALILLSPVVHPWYLLWPLAPALVLGAWPWAVLASTVLLSYLVLGSYDVSVSAWLEPWWIPWLEYPPLVVATAVWWRTRRRPSGP